MILQALKEYYNRKASDPSSDIAPEGFEKKEFPFIIVIDKDGKLNSLEDTREKIGKKLIGKQYLVPRSKSRTGGKSYETTFLLWDHFGYLLNHPESDEKAPKQHKTWLDSLDALPLKLKENEEVSAIIKFYKVDGVRQLKESASWQECAKLNSCNMTFRISGESFPVPCHPVVQEYVRTSITASSEIAKPSSDKELQVFARCLVTGEFGEIVRTHARTPINKDTKSLISFQKNSGYDSYGKEQGYNAPVCKSAEFAYTTGLNTLLKSERSRMLVGDAVTVFWSAKKSDLENDFFDFFNQPDKDDPDRGIKAVQSLFSSIQNGAFSISENTNKFYVLGLAPNAARISIRFWIVDTVAGMAGKIAQYFEDIRIVHGPKESGFLSLYRLLKSTAVQEKPENIPPNLAGDTMRSILEGLPYPETLLQALVRRNRAEQNVSYPRAAFIKACINRKNRFYNQNIKEELKMSLDPTNTNIGYRLGRLFATLEKIQEEASPGINATIRDRFYGAASGTPVTVFPNLMRLKNHHLAKLESQGRKIYFEKLLAEILNEGIDGTIGFPAALSIDNQGRFAIGYYHQRNDFFTKK